VFENQLDKEETTVERYVRKEKARRQRRKKRRLRFQSGTVAQDSQDEEAEEEPVEDLGFDDPFFARR